MDRDARVGPMAGPDALDLPPWRKTAFALAILLLRLTFGLLFLSNGVAKLPGLESLDWAPFPGFYIDYDGAKNSLDSDSNSHPIGLYRNLVDDVLLEHFGLFGAGLIVL